MKRTGISFKELISDWKKITFLVLLIIFVPSAIYLLIKGFFLQFFLMALIVYGIIKFLNRKG